MKRAGIPEWAWVLFAVLGILALALWLRRKLGRAPAFGLEPAP